jgi:quercetin dioxygenase-like cupin family protein
MDVARAIAELQAGNPLGRIVQNAPDGKHVTEIVREDPGRSSGRSSAVAVIERSPRHHHPRMTEVYRVLRGQLTVHVDDATVVLNKDEKLTIKPGAIHWAESDSDDPARVHVLCVPAFSPDECILDPD